MNVLNVRNVINLAHSSHSSHSTHSSHSPLSADNFYWYASVFIFVPWLLLMFAPNYKHTQRIAIGCSLVLLVAAAVFTIRYLVGAGSDGGSLLSLEGLKNLFRSKEMLLTGWLNYLSYSLIAGTYQLHDARENEIPHIYMQIPLLLTLLLGPAGLLLYLGIRWVKLRNKKKR